MADGGIKYSGDFAKAIAAGAFLRRRAAPRAGTDESLGEVILWQAGPSRPIAGMGSLGAMARGSVIAISRRMPPVTLVPEGIEGRFHIRGLVAAVIHQMVGAAGRDGLYRQCDGNICGRNASSCASPGRGSRKASVHDVQITRESSELPDRLIRGAGGLPLREGSNPRRS
ncbi:MAG: IMP dehydrogenase [Paracoccaceae bacterium]